MMMSLKVVLLVTAIIPVAADGAGLHDTADVKTKTFDPDTSPEETHDAKAVYSPRNVILRIAAWPGGVIPYTIRSFSPAMREKIMEAMREIEHDVNSASSSCIKFVPRSHQSNYISISPGRGCHSAIGYARTGPQEVTLGYGCELKGIIMHELIHSIGFFHEQKRSDRDDYININLNNVPRGHKENYELLGNSIVSNYGAPYDFNSIMHSNAYSFAVDNTEPVMTPKSGKGLDAEMGQRILLSVWDVKKIQRLYQCPEDASHIINPLEPANTMVNCNFFTDFCNLSVTRRRVRWIRTSESTRGGPKRGHSTGNDPYLVTFGQRGTATLTTSWFRKSPVCMDIYLFQAGRNSYLEVYVQGYRLSRQLMASYRRFRYDRWSHVRLQIRIPPSMTFKLIFEAHVVSDPIAIDDMHVYPGSCG